MVKVSVGTWEVEVDPAATHEAYAEIHDGVRCDCLGCENFAAQPTDGWASEVRDLIAKLGIDIGSPAEACWVNREPDGLHFYLAWYHFVGRITKWSDRSDLEGNGTGGVKDNEPLGSDATVYFRDRTDCAHPQLIATGKSLVQVDFSLTLPWVIARVELE